MMILEFLGGAAFRAITGQVVSVWTKYQDHKHEVEMLKLQNDIEGARAERQIKQQELAATLQVRTVEIQRDADVMREEAAAFTAAMANAFKPTGVAWVDAWNGAVRPAFASLVLALWLFSLAANGWQLQDWDKELAGLVVGFFFADRHMRKAGK
jgi:hypothetical protein